MLENFGGKLNTAWTSCVQNGGHVEVVNILQYYSKNDETL
jgi:hypothetical protein